MYRAYCYKLLFIQFSGNMGGVGVYKRRVLWSIETRILGEFKHNLLIKLRL